jgi:hypothetical protein
MLDIQARTYQIAEIISKNKSMHKIYSKKSVDVGIEDINKKQNKIHHCEKNERESEINKVSKGNLF